MDNQKPQLEEFHTTQWLKKGQTMQSMIYIIYKIRNLSSRQNSAEELISCAR